jgi:hypothetical protein
VIERYATIRCDGCHKPYFTTEVSATLARVMAADQGWKRNPPTDVCPECASESAKKEGSP